jgi:hypothetical protein
VDDGFSNGVASESATEVAGEHNKLKHNNHTIKNSVMHLIVKAPNAVQPYTSGMTSLNKHKQKINKHITLDSHKHTWHNVMSFCLM